ncbi:MAG: endonuclease, partial [Thermoanaerobaculia bacterium]|nr:endonuclease [Thermoanaerobaculia bacterium]
MPRTTERRSSGLSTVPRFTALRATLAFAIAAVLAGPAAGQKITEVVFDHVGSPDTHEYVELWADPSADLSSFRVVVLDGSSNPGQILNVVTPGTANGAGFWSSGSLTPLLESPVFTVLLVSGFTGLVGDDLDSGNDGVLDANPWSSIQDGVAFSDGTAGARTYTAPVLGPGFDGNATAPGGASRFPYYVDTNSVTDWKRNDFDGAGLPGFSGTLVSGEAWNTPASVTRVHLEDYYAGVDASSQAALRSTIHAAIENHIWFPYTADTTDTWDILNLAEQDPVDAGMILDKYKNARYTKIAGGTGIYNREHSWPNSYGFPSNGDVPYTDCHHLFATNTEYNGNRGNDPFGTCNSGCAEDETDLNYGFGGGSGTYPGNSNWSSPSSRIYEVWNHRRGDLARAQLYMDVRYEGGTHAINGKSEPQLILTDNLSQITGTSGGTAYMGRLTVLLQWHLADPVDDDERARNDVIASFQGNRNPFVDHPEWVECVFQGICGGNPGIVFSGIQSATDPNLCATGGVGVTWNAPSSWNDDCTAGCDRGFHVLRDGSAITSGGCAGPLTASATSCTDTSGTTGVSYAYAVEAFNHEAETSTGNTSISAADRADDGLAPVLTAGPSASSAVSSSFTVAWTTDEPSDSRLEYGLTAGYGSTAYDATPVTAHSLTVTGLSPSTEYHFRAGSTDPCGNGPAWSSDGTVTTAAVATTLDIGGWQLVQANSTQTYTLPAGTTVPPGGYVVIGRNVEKAAFETAWGVTLGPDVVYLNSGETIPMINGGETYTLKNASGVIVDGPTIALPATFQSVRRNDPCQPAGSAGSWTAGALSTATPGTGAGAGCGTGLVINEFSDASAFANEFVELHWDSSAVEPAPTVATGAASGVTTTGATLNGIVNPNGLATTASFEWGLTTSYGQTTAGQSMGSGSAALPLSASLTGLTACTTYHYRATATSSAGTTNGSDATFETSCPAPVVTTGAATAVTTTGATLNGTVNPNGLATTASFEWGLTTSYGQTTAGQSMGTGSAALPLSASLTGLTACTTYHYRATATSSAGTTNGSDATFETSCPAPVVSTGAASGVTTTGATLNGTVNPN